MGIVKKSIFFELIIQKITKKTLTNMNFQVSQEKINKFGQKAKVLGKSENAHEIRKKSRFMSGR